MRPALAALLLLPLAAAQTELCNPSFEEGEGLPAGWTRGEGARIADSGPRAEIALDGEAARDGRRSLRIRADAATRIWDALFQELPAAPGERWELAVAARGSGIRREGRQYLQANGFLFFLGGDGAVLRREGTEVLPGDREWADLMLQAIAPPGTVRARVGVVFSLSGTVWFDSARLLRRPTAPFSPEVAGEAFRVLRREVARRWPFFGLPGKPPSPEFLDRWEPKARAAADPAALAGVCAEALGGLADLHVSLETPAGPLGTVPPYSGIRNWSEKALRAALAGPLLDEGPFLVGRLRAGPGYARIASFALTGERLARLEQALDALGDAPALVLDVRPNGGGDEHAAARIAARFADAEVIYAKHRFRDPTRPGLRAFGESGERRLGPLPGRTPDRRRVAVLQGPVCVSAAEGFLLMMKALPRTVLVGLPSRGASGNPAPVDLLPGCRVLLSRWQALTPAGECIEGRGVEPHVRVELPQSAYEGRDPALERAVLILAE